MQRAFSFGMTTFLVAATLGVVGCLSEPPGGGTVTNGDEEVPEADSEQQPNGEATGKLDVQTEPYGDTPEGVGVEQFLMSNDKGMMVSVITYGAIVTAVEVPDKEGNAANVTLGFNELDGYTDTEQKDPYFGATVGRYANRIAGGLFSIGDEEYKLATNNAPNHLHGGDVGFSDVVWHGRILDTKNDDTVAVEFSYVSADGEEGYPGKLTATVVYTLTNDNELRIDYTATADKSTPINLTNHCYWNLTGVSDPQQAATVLDHELMLKCDEFLPVDETLIPTGDKQSVAESPMDFTRPMTIGSRFSEVKGDDPNGGYDHCYVINDWDKSLRLAARVHEPKSGRVMEILTTEPGIQLYTGNFLDGKPGSGGFGQHTAFCLECQHFPDSPNQPEFPTTIYAPGEVYKQTTVHRFSIE